MNGLKPILPSQIMLHERSIRMTEWKMTGKVYSQLKYPKTVKTMINRGNCPKKQRRWYSPAFLFSQSGTLDRLRCGSEPDSADPNCLADH